MKITLFSSYSNKSTIDNYIKSYLEQLRKVSDKVVLLTNNDRKLCLNDINLLNHIGVEICYVENRGWDFGMYYQYIVNNTSLFKNCDQLILCNDSCVLFRDITPFIQKFHYNDFVASGFTSSYEIKYHMQSYFLYYKGDAVRLCVGHILNTGILPDRNSVILKYEVGISALLEENNYKFFVEYDSVSSNTMVYNIMLVYPQILIYSGIPMIKRKSITTDFNKDEADYLYTHNYNFSFDLKTYIYKFMINDGLYLPDFVLDGL